MKKRNFYPRQVLQQLNGKETCRLSESQVHALRFFMLRAGKYNVLISLLEDVQLTPFDPSLTIVTGLCAKPLDRSLRVFVRPPYTMATLDSLSITPRMNGGQTRMTEGWQ